jgi:hypothetical protein
LKTGGVAGLPGKGVRRQGRAACFPSCSGRPCWRATARSVSPSFSISARERMRSWRGRMPNPRSGRRRNSYATRRRWKQSAGSLPARLQRHPRRAKFLTQLDGDPWNRRRDTTWGSGHSRFCQCLTQPHSNEIQNTVLGFRSPPLAGWLRSFGVPRNVSNRRRTGLRWPAIGRHCRRDYE